MKQGGETNNRSSGRKKARPDKKRKSDTLHNSIKPILCQGSTPEATSNYPDIPVDDVVDAELLKDILKDLWRLQDPSAVYPYDVTYPGQEELIPKEVEERRKAFAEKRRSYDRQEFLLAKKDFRSSLLSISDDDDDDDDDDDEDIFSKNAERVPIILQDRSTQTDQLKLLPKAKTDLQFERSKSLGAPPPKQLKK